MSGGVFAYTTVWVSLIDINDNAPKFSQDKYVTKVYEEQKRFTYVMQVYTSYFVLENKNVCR
jgi:protocadherin-16/23